jgi:hypothetical protein
MFKGGPLDGRAGYAVPPQRLHLYEHQDESLHLYEFASTSMSDGHWVYVGEVLTENDQALVIAKSEGAVIDEPLLTKIREIVKEEIAKASLTLNELRSMQGAKPIVDVTDMVRPVNAPDVLDEMQKFFDGVIKAHAPTKEPQ